MDEQRSPKAQQREDEAGAGAGAGEKDGDGDEGELKKEAAETIQDFRIDLTDQMKLVIDAFQSIEQESHQRAAISRLQAGVDEADEVDLLTKLLEQKRMKQN